ncbi:hypothetical protein [Thalassoglobus sp.]|uniref:GAP1-N2 domain-containing protein n=1 Tax=Thalassoglobus sp. TaxID=2795869 RepID=UPI003AA8D9D3
MQELLYTSAPKGLKPGSRGFCTVLSSSGMPAPVATALEGLSAYRPVFPPGDPQAKLNPVVSSHILLSLVGQRRHVLSRIADHGLDYSQRTNKLAHHVVLEREDRPAAGPGWFLGSSGFMRSDWDGVPRVVQNERVIHSEEIQPKVCQEWKNATGDAGWGGVLAEAFLADPSRLVYIIFEPGMELLPLIEESIALLPTEKRWDVTFSTYFTKLPKGAVCQCRCVLAGSPEANESRRHVNALRIDLSQEPGVATGGVYVTAARTGELPLDSEPVAPLAEGKVSDGNNSEVDPPSIKIAQDKSTPPKPIPPSRRRQNRKRKAQKSNVGLWGAFFAVLTLLVAVIAIMLLNPPENVPQKETVAKNESQEKLDPVEEGEGHAEKTGEDDSKNTATNKEADGETDTAGEGAEAGADNTEEEMVQNAKSAHATESPKGGQPDIPRPQPDKPEAEEKEPTYTKPGIFNWSIDDLAKNDGKLVYDKLRLPPDAPLSLSVWIPDDFSQDYVHDLPSMKSQNSTIVNFIDHSKTEQKYFECGLKGADNSGQHKEVFVSMEKKFNNIEIIKRFVIEVENTDSKDRWFIVMVKPTLGDAVQHGPTLTLDAVFPQKGYLAKLDIESCEVSVSGEVVDLIAGDEKILELKKDQKVQINKDTFKDNFVGDFFKDLQSVDGIDTTNFVNLNLDAIIRFIPAYKISDRSKIQLSFSTSKLVDSLDSSASLLMSRIAGRAGDPSQKNPHLRKFILSGSSAISIIEENIDALKRTYSRLEDEKESAGRVQQLRGIEMDYQNIKKYIQKRDDLVKEIDEAKLTYVSIKQHGTNGVEPGYFPFVEFGAPMNNNDEREAPND